MTGPPDEGGGTTVGLQPSGTLQASEEEDVVVGGWAPTFSPPPKAEWSLEESGWGCSSLMTNASLAMGILRMEVAVLMLATLTFPSFPGNVWRTRASGHWFVKRVSSQRMTTSPT